MISCKSSGSVRRHSHKSGTHLPVSKGKENIKVHGLRRALIEEALSWEGTPYKYANSDKREGTDCSGMVLRVYDDVAEIKLPRNSAKQSEYCRVIRQKDVRPGDLVFFATGSDPSRVSHVGMMIDDTRFIHASTKKGVVISDITTPYYQRTFICFGRVPDRKLED
ncbi:MAG: C40 family peptidase [Muribaculaceae bacterium]|nr:C40 family peptidase [Muribaculaceae bacterium]